MKHRLEPTNLDEQHTEKINVADEESKGGDPSFKQRFYIYAGHHLIQFKNESDVQERGRLNIKFARLRKTSLKDEQSKLFGFILMAKGVRLHFYTYDEGTQIQWLKALRKSCVLLDVKDEYAIGRMLGRGNFAKVHACHAKNDPAQK